MARINVHFDANPVLHDNSQSKGLFNQIRRQPVATMITTLSAQPLSPLPLSLHPPPALLSSNVVNTHSFLCTSHPSPSTSTQCQWTKSTLGYLYIRRTTFEFSHLIASFCIFSHLIANIRPDKTEPTCCMSYHIKTYK